MWCVSQRSTHKLPSPRDKANGVKSEFSAKCGLAAGTSTLFYTGSILFVLLDELHVPASKF
jgi:hypothetical protein